MPAPLAARLPASLEALRGFELVASHDPVKTDLEVVCTGCREHLCDAEPGDGLATLVLVALGHECGAPAPAEEPADPGACCRSTGEPFVRHGRACDRYDGWRE